ncbi:wax ester/triacylglycerol synthase family O-acyltransferase [Nocardioides gilvus]|uniref:wax ester/triacylglycerol synthase family O-acyltransferase n=1 Tax=Nocardioides gilvus TaxID=1735589 RepID=UPI000D74D4E0|nr:wax ester/triacylglycerol synthase family O-acyltransferase [Nocardioides gilvus]
MHRLNGEDAGFLHMEMPGQPMNSMAIGVLTGEHADLTLDDVRAHVAGRLDELPSWRWRIVKVPFDLHHPVAVRDPDFDLSRHVQEATIKGGEEELEAWFAHLAEEHLDPDLPLWQVWLVHCVDGPDGPRQALVAKYHHALADGVAAMTTFARVYSDTDFDPLPPIPGHSGEPFTPERIPGPISLFASALWDLLVAVVLVLPGLLLRARRGIKQFRAARALREVEVPNGTGEAPRTLLNDAFTAQRRYVRGDLPLDGMKEIKSVSGTTLNDVVLAVVAGACVRYLEPRGGLPERPLLTNVPMSAEPVGAPARQFGNFFWVFVTSLATDVKDPWERLLQISAVSRASKRELEAIGVDLVPRWLDLVPPWLARRGVRDTVERLRKAETDVDASILVSNVRGPAAPWSIGGRVFTDLHVDGPPSNGVGCNVMVWSYGDRMLFGILAYADALEAPAEFRAALEESYAELLDEAARRSTLPAA